MHTLAAGMGATMGGNFSHTRLRYVVDRGITGATKYILEHLPICRATFTFVPNRLGSQQQEFGHFLL